MSFDVICLTFYYEFAMREGYCTHGPLASFAHARAGGGEAEGWMDFELRECPAGLIHSNNQENIHCLEEFNKFYYYIRKKINSRP